jgi:hypothetical protein
MNFVSLVVPSFGDHAAILKFGGTAFKRPFRLVPVSD